MARITQSEKFNNMFSVSEVKEFFCKQNNINEVTHITPKQKKANRLDLPNLNLYDIDTNELIKVASQRDYNSEFLIQIEQLSIFDVRDFLNHHFEYTPHKQKFIDFVKYEVVYSKIFENNKANKKIIKEWIKSKLHFDKPQQDNNTNAPLQKQPKIITKKDYLKIIVDTYWSSYTGFPFIEALENKYNDTSQDLILSKQAFYNGCLDAANTIKDEIINGCKDLEENPNIINSPITIRGNNKKISLYKSGLITIMGYTDISLNDVNTIVDELNKVIAEPQQKTKTDAPKKDFKQQGWFKVAVLFASGKMQKFYTINTKNEFVIKPEYTAPKIAKDLKIPDYQKEILATLNNYKKGNSNAKKNIFNRTSTELKEVIKFCENKKYDLTPDFIERYNLIKDK